MLGWRIVGRCLSPRRAVACFALTTRFGPRGQLAWVCLMPNLDVRVFSAVHGRVRLVSVPSDWFSVAESPRRVAVVRSRLVPAVMLIASVVVAGCGGAEVSGTSAEPGSSAPSTSSSAASTTGVPASTDAIATTAVSTTRPAPQWAIGGITRIGVEGVSPEIVQREDGSFLLLVTGQPGGPYASADGATFAADPSFSLPPGADFSLLQAADGSWRLYYVDFQPIGTPVPGQPPSPNSVIKTVKVSTSDHLGGFGPGQPTGIGQSEPGGAWGVPDTYTLPDGRTAMIYVDKGSGGEQLMLATSTDGVQFTVSPQPVLTGGYVDPYVLRLDDGSYLALLSTGPGRPPQRLHLASSPDGVTWTVDPKPFFTEPGISYLDPAAVQVGPNEWLLVISTSAGGSVNGRYELVVTPLTRTLA